MTADEKDAEIRRLERKLEACCDVRDRVCQSLQLAIGLLREGRDYSGGRWPDWSARVQRFLEGKRS